MVRINTGFQQIARDGSSRELSNIFKEISRLLANEYVPQKISRRANGNTALAIHEFLKNTLHGDHIIIDIDRLPNHTCVITALDISGHDQLDPAFCAHLGESMIVPTVGNKNHTIAYLGDHVVSQLRIDPSEILSLEAAC